MVLASLLAGQARDFLDIELLEAGFVTMIISQLHIDILCRLLGESLFPMLLVDHSGTHRRPTIRFTYHLTFGAFPGDVLEGLHRRDPLFLSSSMTSVRSNLAPQLESHNLDHWQMDGYTGGKSNSSVGEGQSLFVLELLQLYVLAFCSVLESHTSHFKRRLDLSSSGF